MLPKIVKRVLLNKRLPPILTLLLAPIVFALSLVAFISQGDNGILQHYVVSLNTSTLLQNVLKVQSVASVTARGIDPLITPPPEINERQLFPDAGDVSSFFGGIGSKISTALQPTGTGAAGGLLGGGGTDGGNLANVFGDGSFSDLFTTGTLGDLFNNIGGQAAMGVVSLVNSVASLAIEGLGIADQYSIYMWEYCSANLTDGTQNMGPEACSALRDISVEPSNSTLQVGNVMVDFSALNIPNKLSGASGLIKGVFDAIFAFQIIGIVSTGLIFLVSPPLISSRFQRRIPRALASVLASIAATFITAVAAIEVIIAVAIPAVVNPLGEGLGVDATTGRSFIALVIVSSVFAGILATIWIIHLIVSYHDRTYVRKDSSKEMFSPTSSGRPVISLNDPEEDPSVTEKRSPLRNIPRSLDRFQARNATSPLRSGHPPSSIHPDDQLPPESLFTPRSTPSLGERARANNSQS